MSMYSSGPVITGLKRVYLIRAAMMKAEADSAKKQSTVSSKIACSDKDCVQAQEALLFMQASGYNIQDICRQE